jgi:predicted RNase H-like HicB family nuclease
LHHFRLSHLANAHHPEQHHATHPEDRAVLWFDSQTELAPRQPVACGRVMRAVMLNRVGQEIHAEVPMRGHFTLEYWQDGKFYVGRLREVPGVFSQGESLEELRENMQDAYDLIVTQERPPAPAAAKQQPLELEV